MSLKNVLVFIVKITLYYIILQIGINWNYQLLINLFTTLIYVQNDWNNPKPQYRTIYFKFLHFRQKCCFVICVWGDWGKVQSTKRPSITGETLIQNDISISSRLANESNEMTCLSVFAALWIWHHSDLCSSFGKMCVRVSLWLCTQINRVVLRKVNTGWRFAVEIVWAGSVGSW